MKTEDKIGIITFVLCLVLSPIVGVFTNNRFLSVGVWVFGIAIYGIYYLRYLLKKWNKE